MAYDLYRLSANVLLEGKSKVKSSLKIRLNERDARIIVVNLNPNLVLIGHSE